MRQLASYFRLPLRLLPIPSERSSSFEERRRRNDQVPEPLPHKNRWRDVGAALLIIAIAVGTAFLLAHR